MGVTKQYLRYVPSGVFGVIASPKCNIVFVNLRGIAGRFVAVGACENVIVWDERKSEKVLTLFGASSEVAVIAASPDDKHLAVGYNDGSIRIFGLPTGQATVTFQGHKYGVSCLSFDHESLRLVSGSKDTELVVWDLVNESGLFRLKGHKGVVTRCQFLRGRNMLISSSKDTFVKVWDLDIQHCFKTMVGHRSEVWDFCVRGDDSRIITGAADSELRVWNVGFADDQITDEPKKAKIIANEDEEENDEADNEGLMSFHKYGSLIRRGRRRVVSMKISADGVLLAAHGNTPILELFRILTEEELKTRMAKRRKKHNKKILKESGEKVNDEVELKATLQDEVDQLEIIKASDKIKGFDVISTRSGCYKIVMLLSANCFEIHEVDLSGAPRPATTCTNSVMLPGHRTDIRTISFSSDGSALLSGSGECLKVWNRATNQCIRTLPCGYALTTLFVPGDRHCIVGTKSGHLQVFDMGSSSLIDDIPAHEGAVWSIYPTPGNRGFVSGSADKQVKFWDFELVTDTNAAHSSSKRLSIVHTRTLQLTEDVLCVRLSPDNNFVAVSLLDSTVKICFVDSLKFFLSLYGHKFPVLCMDISGDCSLIVTGSADRNVKIWGMDFGDCHRSLFAHDDSITCLQFVPDTHMFFSAGKDGVIKQWDADNFEKIATLKGHHDQVWAMCISPNGHHVVSAAHDKSIRLWEKSEEVLVLEEEKEMEREAEYENDLVSQDPTVVAGETNTEVGMAAKKTLETVKSAERLIEGLDVYKTEVDKVKEHEMEIATTGLLDSQPPTPHPLMLAYRTPTPEHFLLHVLKNIKSSELEEAMLLLPFSYVIDFLKVLNLFLERRWSIELTCRCTFFLLRIHHGQITANQVLLPVIDVLRKRAVERVRELRDCVGFNLNGLQVVQREVETKEEVQIFWDATQTFTEKKKKKKQKEKNLKRAILIAH